MSSHEPKLCSADFFPAIQSLRDQFLADDGNASERIEQIRAGAEFVSTRLAQGLAADLMFVCTHNSRRSQFAQVWATVAAAAFGLDGVNCFSGGTEVTACNTRTVASLQRSGFQVDGGATGANPKYLVRFAEGCASVECDSNIYTDSGLSDFAAMMCCADVDDKCPTVPGAAVRIPWHYEDPKVADDTPNEAVCYDERSHQIGQDMFRMMALVRSNA